MKAMKSVVARLELSRRLVFATPPFMDEPIEFTSFMRTGTFGWPARYIGVS
jgi:hypothetical protein